MSSTFDLGLTKQESIGLCNLVQDLLSISDLSLTNHVRFEENHQGAHDVFR